MDGEDVTFFSSMNQKRDASTQCSDNDFEDLMNYFEEIAQLKQPFSAVDSPPVLSFEEVESGLDENIGDHAKTFAREIYEHWKALRLRAGNKSLITSLKVRDLSFVIWQYC